MNKNSFTDSTSQETQQQEKGERTTPGGGRTNVTSVVVGQEGLHTHKLRENKHWTFQRQVILEFPGKRIPSCACMATCIRRSRA
jgi:hypothetical protein